MLSSPSSHSVCWRENRAGKLSRSQISSQFRLNAHLGTHLGIDKCNQERFQSSCGWCRQSFGSPGSLLDMDSNHHENRQFRQSWWKYTKTELQHNMRTSTVKSSLLRASQTFGPSNVKFSLHFFSTFSLDNTWKVQQSICCSNDA